MFAADRLEEILSALGEVLKERDLDFEVVAIGGGSLLLLGLIDRPTRDLDIIALVNRDRYVSAETLPSPLVEAVRDVARLYELPDDWFNAKPALQLRAGLPPGFEQRVVHKRYGTLKVQVASREDQIAFKLYAAVDSGRKSVHLKDLQVLEPDDAELEGAARWVRTQDAGPEFSEFVDQVIELVRGRRVT